MSNVTLLSAERYTSKIKVEHEYTVDREFIYVPKIELQIQADGQISKATHGSITAKQIQIPKDLVERIIQINTQILTLKNEGKKIVSQLFSKELMGEKGALLAERSTSPTLQWRGFGQDRELMYIPQYKVEIEDGGRVREKNQRSRTIIGERAYNKAFYTTSKLPYEKRCAEAEKAAIEAERTAKAVKQIYVEEELVKRVVEISKQLCSLETKLKKDADLLFTEKHDLEESKNVSEILE